MHMGPAALPQGLFFNCRRIPRRDAKPLKLTLEEGYPKTTAVPPKTPWFLPWHKARSANLRLHSMGRLSDIIAGRVIIAHPDLALIRTGCLAAAKPAGILPHHLGIMAACHSPAAAVLRFVVILPFAHPGVDHLLRGDPLLFPGAMCQANRAGPVEILPIQPRILSLPRPVLHPAPVAV